MLREGNKIMDDRTEESAGKIREFFNLKSGAELLAPGAGVPELSDELVEGLGRFHIEWHVVPRAEVLPLDDSYFSRLYPRAPRDFTRTREHKPSYRDVLARGHELHQGRVVGVEATRKPRYLPENRQFYGTAYGHDPSADPFAAYMGRAGMVNGTRYAHNYLSLREFMRVVNEDWRARGLLPARRLQPRRCALSHGVERDGESGTRLLPRQRGQRDVLRRRLGRPRRLLLHRRGRGRGRVVARGLPRRTRA
jgi:hypothetical protein